MATAMAATAELSISLDGLIKFDVQVLVKALGDIIARLNASDAKVEKLEKQSVAREHQLLSHYEKIKELQGQMKESETDRNAMRDRIEALEAAAAETQKELAAAKEDLAATSSVANEALELAKKNTGKKPTVAGDTSGLEKRVDELEQTSLQHDVDITNTKALAEAIQAALEPLPGQVEALEATVEGVKTDLGVRIKKNEDDIAELKKQVQELIDAGGVSGDDLRALEKRITHVIGEVQQATQEKLDNHSLQIKQLQEQMKNMPKASGDGAAVHALGLKIDALKERVRELENQCEVLPKHSDELKRLAELIAELLKKMEGLNGGGGDVTQADLAAYATLDALRKVQEDLEAKIDAMGKKAHKDMKNELRRFEKDLMAYITEWGDGKSTTSETNAGRIHFRCIACDQPQQSMPGASTNNFKQATSGVGVHIGPAVTGQRSERIATMTVERGEEVSLFGRDGQVYKGRESGKIHYSTGSESDRSMFTVTYRDKDKSRSSRGDRAQSATPQRPRSTDRQQVRAGWAGKTQPLDKTELSATPPTKPNRPTTANRRRT